MFGSLGFAGVLTDSLVSELGLSRGALYHHFRTKEELFAAVLEDVEAELVNHVLASGLRETDPWAQLRAALDAYLELCIDPVFARIIFVDGPAVLGLDAWYEMDERYAFAYIVEMVQRLVDEEMIDRVPVVPLADVVFGGLIRAGMSIARSTDPAATRAEMGELLDRLVEGLRGAPFNRRRKKAARGAAPAVTRRGRA